MVRMGRKAIPHKLKLKLRASCIPKKVVKKCSKVVSEKGQQKNLGTSGPIPAGRHKGACALFGVVPPLGDFLNTPLRRATKVN